MGFVVPTRRESLLEGLDRRIAFGGVFGGQVVEVVAVDDVTSKLNIVILIDVREERRKREVDSLRQIHQSLHRPSQAPQIPRPREVSSLELNS